MEELYKHQNLIGQVVPDLELDAFHHEETIKINPAKMGGKWSILFFYPADFTFVCPTELEDMAETYEKFQSLNTEILSVSTDTVYVHKAWHDQSEAIKKVKYPMLADPAAKLSKLLGVYLPEDGLDLRATFIVNPEGIIKSYEINDNSIGRNSDELLRKLQAAQFVAEHGDKVCPAKWQPGKDTLTPGLDLVGKI